VCGVVSMVWCQVSKESSPDFASETGARVDFLPAFFLLLHFLGERCPSTTKGSFCSLSLNRFFILYNFLYIKKENLYHKTSYTEDFADI
jgi:hypothetical protein